MTYTHGHADSVLRSHRWRTAANSAAYLLGRLEPGTSLLDIGCGPGTLTADLARAVDPGRVVGIDREPAVLEEARRTAEEAGLTNIEFHEGDVYELAFDDGAFDVVHAHQVLQHLERPVSALEEMGRVCRPGGTVAARDGDYAAFTWFPQSDLLDRWLEIYRAVAAANGGEPDAGRRLLSWAREAGFAKIEPSASVWCYATAEERGWWADLWADRTTSTRLATSAKELGMSDEQELTAIAAGWRAWAEDQDGWFAVLHGEILCEA